MSLGALVFCCVNNYFKARAANLNAALWALFTFIAYGITWFIGGIIVTLIMITRDPQLREIAMKQPSDPQAAVRYLESRSLIIPELFLIVCGIGGYLFIRHLILKRKVQE